METKVFQHEAEIVINELTAARTTIASIGNPEFELVRNPILIKLTNMINHCRFHQLGLHPETFDLPGTKEETLPLSQPLTKMFGMDLTAPKAGPSPQEVAVADLILQVSLLQERFATQTNDQILDATPDIVIRGLAKKLDFPVSETSPKKLTVVYVQEMREKMERAAAVQEQPEENL